MREILYGINAVRETLLFSRRKIYKLIVVKKPDNKRIKEIEEFACRKSILIEKVSGRWMMERFPDRQDQGVALVTGPYRYFTFEQLMEKSESRNGLLVAVDEVRDPVNIGTIARNIAVLGADGLIIHNRRCGRVTPVAVKASSGMVEKITVSLVPNLANCLRALKNKGYKAIGLDPLSPRIIYDESFDMKTVVVLGSEGKGMRKLTRSMCDSIVSIPSAERNLSLNVSSASAIVLYEVMKQKKKFLTGNQNE